MAISDLIAKTTDPAFYHKIGFLAVKVAQQVASEDPNTTDHAVRAQYAARIVRGEDNLLLLSAHVVASNGTIQSTIEAGNEPSDGDLEFALASIWTSRGKAYAAAV